MIFVRFLFVSLLVCAFGIQSAAAENLSSWIQRAEQSFYDNESPDYLDRTGKILDQMEKKFPTSEYPHWARARLAFWEKETFYLREKAQPERSFRDEKLALADECHKHIDQCFAHAPESAECHMMKGVCYAMQGSTWGKSVKTLRILKKMDRSWVKAIETPSTFQHFDGIFTRHLSLALRAIQYRLMPDSWWFRIIAGIRGDKEKAYRWMTSAIIGPLKKDPVTLLELAMTQMCYGNEIKDSSKVEDGKRLLKEGLTFKVRNDMDLFDRERMKYFLEHPDKACEYRREKIEAITDQGVKQAIEG